MADDKGFEPYIDWDGVTDDMTEDLHRVFIEAIEARNKFASEKSNENAASLLRAQSKLGGIAEAIERTLFVMPMMVHVAGDKTRNEDEEGHDQVIQRCTRCGSTLQVWKEGYATMSPHGPVELEEGDLPWWDSGDVVAKASQDMATTMYEIKDRELEKYEMPCPDLTGLSG